MVGARWRHPSLSGFVGTNARQKNACSTPRAAPRNRRARSGHGSWWLGAKSLWGTSPEAYFRVDELLRQLANPNLHDIPRDPPFRVEMWDRSDQHIRWVIAASASVAIGHAAMDAAMAANYPDQRFTLQNGIL